MKAYSIGREGGCDIVINDTTDVISRRHAILNVMPSGKMTIVDQSHNGTYVNGIRISPNVPVPVTRKDNISFAHVARLDWNRVPKTISPMQYAIYGLIAVLVILAVVFSYKAFINSDSKETEKTESADSALLKQKEVDAAAKDLTEESEKEDTGNAKDTDENDNNKTDDAKKKEAGKSTGKAKTGGKKAITTQENQKQESKGDKKEENGSTQFGKH